jgi:hypothetical protein
METLPHLINKKDESSWQKASASLDASAKIYGYRVDSVHSETFKFLGGLSRADMKEENKDNEDESAESSSNRERKKANDKVTVRVIFMYRMVQILWKRIPKSLI